MSVACFVLACLAIVLAAPCHAAGDEQATDDDEGGIFARSLVTLGDTARLQHALAKARRGEKVVVGVIGGSITQGALASRAENRWGNRVAKWWRDAFPGAEIKFVNAGIGATGSDIGAHRVRAHLLAQSPDFVGIEFGVNDPNTELAAETLEGLVRQIVKQPNRPAAMLLFTMNNAGGNAQEWHGKIGRHYGLPMVSFRDALWPEIEAGRLKWEDVEADLVHPNDRGHEYCAGFVTAALEQVLAELPADADLPPISEMPGPLISDVFEHTAILNAEDLTPTRNQGWQPSEAGFGKCWEADEPGSVLEFQVEGTAISVVFYRVKGDMGIAEVQVDDGPPVRLNAWFEADWGGYSPLQLLARDPEPGAHTLRIELLEERAEASQGHRFQVQAILTAGLRVED